MAKLSGPIPGENFTSDTKNYPWHRPPELTDLDTAIDTITKKLMSDESSPGIITMLQTGVDVASLTEMFLMSGIGAGKWTPDFALLLAGPTSHIIYLMAKAHDVKCELGIEREKPRMTKAFFEGMKVDKAETDAVREAIDSGLVNKTEEAVASMGGFMGAKPPVERV